MENIGYVPLDPFDDYVYISDLKTRLRFGLKALPYVNFKLEYKKLKSSLSSWVIRDFGKLDPKNPSYYVTMYQNN